MTDKQNKLKQELLEKIYLCSALLCTKSSNVQTDLVNAKGVLSDLLLALMGYLEDDLYEDD